MKRTYMVAAFSLLLSTTTCVTAAEAPMTEIVKNYQSIKSKIETGKKVRVITWVKGIERAKPRTNFVSQKFEHALSFLNQQGITTQRTLPRIGAIVLEVDNRTIDALIKSGRFEKIEEDIAEAPSLVESTDHINANLVHTNGFTGDGQAVAIIDTGVESWHPFYSSRLVEEACFSSNSSYSTSLCPNGQNTQYGTNAANDCSSTGISRCDHGTHVAGIAAGNNQNMKGVAPDANIVAIQVFSQFPASYDSCGGVPCILTWSSDQLAALEWVLNNSTTNNIAAINMSIGSYTTYSSACDTDSRAGTISDLKAQGIATIISSGNSYRSDGVSSPGCISSAITVGSTHDTNDSISSFSNSSSLVDLLAPGGSITSSVVGGNYGTKSGTSMAAPHIAGAFAVMREANPNASTVDIEATLKNTGVQVTDSRNNITFPRVNLSAAVDSYVDPTLGTKIYEQSDASGKISIAVFERYSNTAAQHNTDFAVTVPSDYVVIGGGAEGTNTPYGNLVTASYPNSNLTAWLASTKDHYYGNPVRVRAWAIGLKINGLSAEQVRSNITVNTATSSSTAAPDVTATLPSGYVLVGGGIKVNSSWAGQLATASSPSGSTGWRVRSKDHYYSSPTTAVAYAIGLKNSIFGIGTISSIINSGTSGVAAHPSHTVNLSNGYALSGCGAYVNWSGAGNLLWRIKPSGPSSCAAASKDHMYSSWASITSYALGIRAN